MAGDWAFVATDQAEEQQGALYIVNVADPARPFIEGEVDGRHGRPQRRQLR